MFGLVDSDVIRVITYLFFRPTCHRRTDQSARQIGNGSDVRNVVLALLFVHRTHLGAETGAKTSARAL